MRYASWMGAWAVVLTIACSASAADQEKLFADRCEIKDSALQRDFPAMCLDAAGTPLVAYLEFDGKADVLRLAKKTDKGLENVAQLAGPGVLHQPAIARDGTGAIWSFWGQLGDKDIVNLHARRWASGKLDAPIVLAESAGSDTFADAAADAAGRVWVIWQSLRRGQGDIYTRYYDPKSGQWSAETHVSAGMTGGNEGGDWEPRVAFAAQDGAWIAFDSSRGNEFNLYLAHVTLDGRTQIKQLTKSPRYEARASIAAAADGKGLWIASERGREGWGMVARSHGPLIGLNAQKRVLLGYYDIAAGTFTEMPPATGILARWLRAREGAAAANEPAAKPGKKKAAKAGKKAAANPGKKAAANASQGLGAVNLPQVVVDAGGNPWIVCRYYLNANWRVAAMKFDAAAKAWCRPAKVEDSSFCQDRHCSLARGADGLWLCWPSDGRTNKTCGVSGVFLGRLDPQFAPVVVPPADDLFLDVQLPGFLNAPTPERPRADHHSWTFADKKYGLYWGDCHRHTDVSVCITQYDGCVLEQFRYAYDMAKLDFLGTSDHTDHGKVYDPYEWWLNQRMVDIFYVPGAFNSMYAYEREQRWPWGHRNAIFAQRGAPIVYIQRENYRRSPWHKLYPDNGNSKEIDPDELWKILHKYGKPVALISHTGATGMGTDWELYRQIDNSVEDLVEIYQGARVSYEGLGAPQPTVGLTARQAYNASSGAADVFPPARINDFGKFNHGVYQNALRMGHKLGVFADSDHISQHTSFGGVYTDDFSRTGIIAALNARHTIAATDKIYLEFSCNGQMLGSIFKTGDKPQLKIVVNGTAPVRRVTVIRNETDYKVFEPGKRDFAVDWTDESPIAGENRYYVRVEQSDGNMAWASPVWVTFEKK